MSGARLLLIDDDELLCDILTSLLALEGYTVTRAANGEEGLQKLAQGQFDLILLDLLMPRMDGVRFLRIFQDQPEPRPPVIVLSASASGAILENINQTDITDIIRKPVKPAELLQKIASALIVGKT